MKRGPSLGVALLLAAATVAGAQTSLPPEIRDYYEAWEYLATSSTAEQRRAALEARVAGGELGHIRSAMRAVEQAEEPFRIAIRSPAVSARWLQPLPRYEVSVRSAAPDGRSLVLACRAALADRSELYRANDDPHRFSTTLLPGGGALSLGIELHRWVKTDAGWKRRYPTPVLVD